MPPTTYPVARSASAGSASTALRPPAAAASAFRSSQARDRDNPHGQRAVHRRDQRLEHPLRRDAERLAGLQAVVGVPRAAGPGAVLVRMNRVRDALLGQHRDGQASPVLPRRNFRRLGPLSGRW